jgi:hypothetical protein
MCPTDENRTAKPPQSQPGRVAPHDQQKDQITQFVTTIKNPAEQIGEHVIQALQHDDTVAVLTTVVLGSDGQKRVNSAALDPKRMQQVQEILTDAEQEREAEEPCVGFHCLIKPKKKEGPKAPAGESNSA